MNNINENKDNIKVILRVRPKIDRETEQANLLKVEGNSLFVSTKSESKQFTYDFIASEESSQAEIFENCGREIADYTLQGYNGTIFVYGQTGAGKTYTLLGPKFSNSSTFTSEELNNSFARFYKKKEEESRGILPRVIDYLFDKRKTMENCHMTFSCSFLEIYQEQIKDLLEPEKNNNVFIRDYSDSVIIEGLSKVTVNSSEEALDLVIKGILN
jgi:hypothetical protein